MKALRLCGKFFVVQRNSLFLIDQDGKLMSNTYEWCADGIEPHKEQLQGLPVEKYSWQVDLKHWWNWNAVPVNILNPIFLINLFFCN